MKKLTFLIIILLFGNIFILSSQSRKIILVDDNQNKIKNFQATVYAKDTSYIFKNSKNNYFLIKKNIIIDSVHILFDGFYENLVKKEKIINNDTIRLKKTIYLSQVFISNNKNTKEIGVNCKTRNIKKLSNLSTSESLIRIDVSNYSSATIKSLSLYLFNNFYHSSYSNKKLSSQNKKIQLYLFQSDSTPNGKTKDLLSKPLIIDTKDLKKGWKEIDLSKLKINIDELNYLFIGYKCVGSPIATGFVKEKHAKNEVIAYRRNSNSISKKWNEIKVSVPAIKIKIEYK